MTDSQARELGEALWQAAPELMGDLVAALADLINAFLDLPCAVRDAVVAMVNDG